VFFGCPVAFMGNLARIVAQTTDEKEYSSTLGARIKDFATDIQERLPEPSSFEYENVNRQELNQYMFNNWDNMIS